MMPFRTPLLLIWISENLCLFYVVFCCGIAYFVVVVVFIFKNVFERQSYKISIHWIIAQIALWARGKGSVSNSHLGRDPGVGPLALGHLPLFPRYTYRGAGLEAEQVGLERTHCVTAGSISLIFTSLLYFTVLFPVTTYNLVENCYLC